MALGSPSPLGLPLRPDPLALTALYAEHHSWLLGRLVARLHHREDAEDLAAETFAQIAARIGPSQLQEPRAYLTTIAHRLLFHFWRRRDLERACLQYLDTLPEALAASPEDRTLVLETLSEIDRRLDGLSERARKAFLMSQLEELSYEQIAAKLGVSCAAWDATCARRWCCKSMAHSSNYVAWNRECPVRSRAPRPCCPAVVARDVASSARLWWRRPQPAPPVSH